MPEMKDGKLEESPGDREKIEQLKASDEKTKQAMGVMLETSLETGLSPLELITEMGVSMAELELLDARKVAPGEAFFSGYLLGKFEP